METFFCDEDCETYIELVAESCERARVEIWAYCLMPNHVHLIGVPERAESLARALGEAHRRYTRRVNFREGWRGYLWQGRFASFPMDETHCLCAARYVELNPVRAGLAETPEAYRWSSARAHFAGEDDGLVKAAPLLEMAGDWGGFLAEWPTEAETEQFRRHARTGRPLGTHEFTLRLENQLQRRLRPQKPGPKPGGK